MQRRVCSRRGRRATPRLPTRTTARRAAPASTRTLRHVELPGHRGGDQGLLAFLKDGDVAVDTVHGRVNRAQSLPDRLDNRVLFLDRWQRYSDRFDVGHVDRLVGRTHSEPAEEIL